MWDVICLRKFENKKKRVIIFLVIAIITFILLLIFLWIFIRFKKTNIYLVSNRTIEINGKVYLEDFVKGIDNGKIISSNDLVDTSKLGKIELKLKYLDYFKKKKIYCFEVEVVDTEKPIITYKDNITIKVGNDVDLLDGVLVVDNSKEDIKVEVIGEYDIHSVGTYSLKYKAVDSSGNVCEEDFHLIVENVKTSYNGNGIEMIDGTYTTSKGYTLIIKNGIAYVDGTLIVNKTYSLPSSYKPQNPYTSVSGEYCNDCIDKDGMEAFKLMKADATALGLNIYISSGYRSWNNQNSIYNYYVSIDGRTKADTYSARPGHSEHQTGLAFDLNTIDDSFTNTEEGKWIHHNCYKYGFILRYPKGKESITGYMHESWHLRYVGIDLANKLYNDGDWITLEEYYGLESKYSN